MEKTKIINENEIKSLENIFKGIVIKIGKNKEKETKRKDLGVVVSIDETAKSFRVYTQYKKSACKRDHILEIHYTLYGEDLQETFYQYFHNTEKGFDFMNEKLKEYRIN